MPARSKSPERTGPPLLEWIVSALGLLIVVSAIGVLLVQAVKGEESHADITTRVQGVDRVQSGWRVRIEAANIGDHAAAQVQIEGSGGGETASATLDYLPGHGRHEASLMFETDPRADLDVRAVGWMDP